AHHLSVDAGVLRAAKVDDGAVGTLPAKAVVNLESVLADFSRPIVGPDSLVRREPGRGQVRQRIGIVRIAHAARDQKAGRLWWRDGLRVPLLHVLIRLL